MSTPQPFPHAIYCTLTFVTTPSSLLFCIEFLGPPTNNKHTQFVKMYFHLFPMNLNKIINKKSVSVSISSFFRCCLPKKKKRHKPSSQ